MKKIIPLLLVAVIAFGLAIGGLACNGEETGQQPAPTSTAPTGEDLLPKVERFRVATTTSLYDTGLWGYLEPMFEDEYNVELDILSAGTGIALEYGQRGDVDAITVHSKSREEQFVADGYGVERVPFAYNYFLIVGPEDDPAGIKGMEPEEAFARLAEAGTEPFISRGDDSGTHGKEKSIWAAAGYDYEDIRTSGSWYVEAALGMGPTLMMANEGLKLEGVKKQGYTLTDMGTFLAYSGDIDLVAVVDQGSILLNVYSVIACTAAKDADMAQNLVDFLTSDDIQELIGNYGTSQYNQSLFTPCAGDEPTS